MLWQVLGEIQKLYRGKDEDMKFAARLDEKKNDIDSFTVQFYGDSVLIGKQELPLGQICTDILNVDDEMKPKHSNIQHLKK